MFGSFFECQVTTQTHSTQSLVDPRVRLGHGAAVDPRLFLRPAAPQLVFAARVQEGLLV